MFSMIVAKKLVGNVRPELYDEAQSRGPTARDKNILDLIQGNGHWLGAPQDLDIYVWWVKGYLGKMCNAGTVQALLNNYPTTEWKRLERKGVLVRRLAEGDGEVGLAINGLTKRCPATLASEVIKLIHRGSSPSPLYPDLSMCRDWIVEKSATDKELEECINKLVKADPSWYLGTERTQTNTNYLADIPDYPARSGTVGLDPAMNITRVDWAKAAADWPTTGLRYGEGRMREVRKMENLAAPYGNHSSSAGKAGLYETLPPPTVFEWEAALVPTHVTTRVGKSYYELHEGNTNQSNNATQSQSKEETTMKTAQSLNIRTVTFIGNNPADHYSDEQIYSLIAEREATINYYTAMKNQPERLKVSLTTIQKEIDDLVKIVDARV